MKNDIQLYEAVKRKLVFEPGIDPSNITFSIKNGIATINGKVSGYPEKKIIKRAIRNIDGVKGVADEVMVSPETSFTRSDTAIAESAVKALELDITLPQDKIKVSVENGKVTLTGEVPWFYQRQNAERDIDYQVGIVDIDNQIVIKPYMPITSPQEVREQIKEEFERHALFDAQTISIDVAGSNITLRGQVQSWAEVREAAYIAWSIPGVTNVDNQITII